MDTRSAPPPPADRSALGRGQARLLALAAAAGLAVPGAHAAPAPPVVERLEVRGASVIPVETLLFFVSTKPGDRYDEPRLREDFRRLWKAGFLEDLWLEVENGASGKVVVFRVTEQRRLRIVDYRGSRALTASKIADRLEEEGLKLPLEGFYDAVKVRKVQEAVRRMLEEQGFPFAEVRHEAKPLSASGVQLSFLIDDGLKALVRHVGFDGNESFSDGKLRGRMKSIKPRSFWNLSWLTGKSTFTREKWEEDQKRLRAFLLDRGRIDAAVGEPRLTYEDGRSGFFKKRPVKWLRLEVPVTEGPTYRVGDVRFEGLALFREADVRPLFDLDPGETYRESRVQKGFERLRDEYGREGYFQFTGYAERQPDPERRVVDLVLHMDEDKRYSVDRIVFHGNETTKDKVIRRELFLNEGDVLNMQRLRESVRRLNQLGYFKSVDAPQVSQSTRREDAVDLAFRLEEQGRTQFAFTAGTGGLEGTTYTFSVSTPNLLGGGRNLTAVAQRGDRYRNYQLAFSEPYLFDRRISGGFDVYRRRLEVPASQATGRPGYVGDESTGRLSLGLPLGRFTRVLSDYSYSVLDVQAAEGTDPARVDAGRRRESRMTPSFVFSTVDSPFFPRRGVRLAGSVSFVGGPLGGTVDYLEPGLKAVGYVPLTRRTAFGLRAETGWLVPFGDTARTNPVTGRNGIPFQRRYFLGGETQIRGYDTLDVGPRNAAGERVGGNKFVLGSAEYYVDVGGPFRALLFVDAGQSFGEGDPLDLGRLKTSTGVELRFLMPVLNVPIRLIQAWNFGREPGQKKSDFRVSFGASF